MAEKVRDPPHPDWNGLRAVTPEHTSSLDSVATSGTTVCTWMEEQLEAELPATNMEIRKHALALGSVNRF